MQKKLLVVNELVLTETLYAHACAQFHAVINFILQNHNYV